MKIRITVTIDVDPAAWCEEYGDEPSEVRERVKEYVISGVANSAAGMAGCLRVNDTGGARGI